MILTPRASQDSVQISQVLPDPGSRIRTGEYCHVETGQRQTETPSVGPTLSEMSPSVNVRFNSRNQEAELDRTRPNRPRKDPEKTQKRPRKDPEQTQNRPRTDPELKDSRGHSASELFRLHPVHNINTPAQVNTVCVDAVHTLLSAVCLPVEI